MEKSWFYITAHRDGYILHKLHNSHRGRRTVSCWSYRPANMKIKSILKSTMLGIASFLALSFLIFYTYDYHISLMQTDILQRDVHKETRHFHSHNHTITSLLLLSLFPWPLRHYLSWPALLRFYPFPQSKLLSRTANGQSFLFTVHASRVHPLKTKQKQKKFYTFSPAVPSPHKHFSR